MRLPTRSRLSGHCGRSIISTPLLTWSSCIRTTLQNSRVKKQILKSLNYIEFHLFYSIRCFSVSKSKCLAVASFINCSVLRGFENGSRPIRRRGERPYRSDFWHLPRIGGGGKAAVTVPSCEDLSFPSQLESIGVWGWTVCVCAVVWLPGSYRCF